MKISVICVKYAFVPVVCVSLNPVVSTILAVTKTAIFYTSGVAPFTFHIYSNCFPELLVFTLLLMLSLPSVAVSLDLYVDDYGLPVLNPVHYPSHLVTPFGVHF